MSSVPDFSQASAAAAVERATPEGGEPVRAADAEAGVAGLAADPHQQEQEQQQEPEQQQDPGAAGG